MKFPKVLKNKKGAALEMAILFMVIVFCFCTLLTTMTLTARSRIKLEKVYFNLDLDEDPVPNNIAKDMMKYFDEFLVGPVITRDENNKIQLPSPIITSILNDKENSDYYAFSPESPYNYLTTIRGIYKGTLPSIYADYTEVDDKGRTVLINPASQVDYYVEEGKMICTLTLCNSSNELVTVVVAYTLNDDGTSLTKEIIQDK